MNKYVLILFTTYCRIVFTKLHIYIAVLERFLDLHCNFFSVWFLLLKLYELLLIFRSFSDVTALYRRHKIKIKIIVNSTSFAVFCITKMMGCSKSKGCGCMTFHKKSFTYEDESTSSCRSSEAEVQVRTFRGRKIKPTAGILRAVFNRSWRGWRKNEDLSMTKIERSK